MSRHATEFDWTPEAIERLRQMCAEGYTGGQIAKAWGVSRNTICGKVKRLHLPRGVPSGLVKLAATIRQPADKSRAKPRSEWKRREPRKREHQALPTLPTPAKPRALPPDEPTTATAVTTADLAHGQCRWCINDGKPQWLHCGAPATDGPYCEAHAERARGAGSRSEREAA